jgi:hypothetical protein
VRPVVVAGDRMKFMVRCLAGVCGPEALLRGLGLATAVPCTVYPSVYAHARVRVRAGMNGSLCEYMAHDCLKASKIVFHSLISAPQAAPWPVVVGC